MRTVITLPVPLESSEVWKIFRGPITRFCDTYRKFPPGCDCEIFAMTCQSDADTSVTSIFHDLPVTFLRYDGEGADLGSAQKVSAILNDAFMVNMTSRVFFHREGWLKRIVTAREAVGPDLFGCFASRESGHLHLCTRAYCLDASDFNAYPTRIASRDQGVYFECGDGCIMDWMEARGRKSWVVGWGGIYGREDWFSVKNRFRDGDQSDCLVFDKHTEAYQNADDLEKKRLEKMALEGYVSG